MKSYNKILQEAFIFWTDFELSQNQKKSEKEKS